MCSSDLVLLAQAGRFGGWSLYIKDGKPTYTYNWLGLQRYTVTAPQALTPGKATIRFELAYDGGGPGKGGTVTLYVDGESVGAGRVEATVPFMFSSDETTDVGRDTASPVSDDYSHHESVFNGTVDWVQIDIGEAAEDLDHLLSPEERMQVAMARQ